MLNGFFSTFMLVSRIRIPFDQKPDYRDFAIYVPLIGLIVSFYNIIVFCITGFFLRDYILTGVLVLVFQYLAFNLFHFDGLLDTADAFLCFTDKEKRLKILKDSVIGVFAFFTGGIYLFLKFYLFIVLMQKSVLIPLHTYLFDPKKYISLLIILAFPVCGRISAVILPVFLNPARKTGLGSLLSDYNPLKAVIGIFIVLFLLFLLLISSMPVIKILYFFLILLTAALLSFLFVYRVYRRGIGGLTGDAMGCVIETGELVYLLLVFILQTHFPGIIL